MKDPVKTVIAAFDRVNLVALGERHWAREDAQFRLSLIQNPAFARKVNDIVIEFGNPLYQAALDRFVYGEEVPSAELRKVWQDTTQPGTWDSPVYEAFILAVRSVNASLPSGRRLRVLAGDLPMDWSAMAPGKLLSLDARDASAATVIQREVLAKNRKALVLFGSAHIYRGRAGSIIDLLKHDSKATWFVITPIGGPGLPAAITASEATAGKPALLITADGRVGDLAAADVLERETKRIKVVDGKPVFLDGKPVFIPPFEPGVKVRDLADACLYFGSALPEFVGPPPGLYEGTQYGREIQRRRQLLVPPR